MVGTLPVRIHRWQLHTLFDFLLSIDRISP